MTVSRKQYWAIKNALTKQQKALISYYELQWFLRNRIPTIEEVATHLKAKQTEVNYWLTLKPVQKALDEHGITNWRNHTQTDLTATQIAAALTVMNFIDTRSNEQKLDQLGILPATYYAWQQDPQFKNLLQNLADQNLGNIRPTAIAEFSKLIHKGDWQAVKYYLDVSGEFKQEGAPQAEVLFRMIIEVIQRHVKDPKIITAIAEDLELVAANKKLELVAESTSTAATGHLQNQSQDPVIEGMTVEQAQKRLGY